MWRFISENGALDAFLPGDGVIDVFAPDEHCVSVGCPKNDVFAGTNELASAPAIRVAVAGVVPFVEFEATGITILRHVPKRFKHRAVVEERRSLVAAPSQRGSL